MAEERHKGCIRYKDVLVAPNKNPGSLFMLLQEKIPNTRAIENAYKASMNSFMEIWKKSGVEMRLMNYRVGDDPRWKKDEDKDGS